MSASNPCASMLELTKRQFVRLAGLSIADRIFSRWLHAESQARSQNKVIIVSFAGGELGRDGDVNAANGFLNHRSGDPSCRNVWLLGLGAGVPKGETERNVQHVDVAATAAELLAFQCKATRRPLKELSL